MLAALRRCLWVLVQFFGGVCRCRAVVDQLCDAGYDDGAVGRGV